MVAQSYLLRVGSVALTYVERGGANRDSGAMLAVSAEGADPGYPATAQTG